jgi:monoamine oxidase
MKLFQTSEDTNTKEIIIIGSGMAGVSTAKHLTKILDENKLNSKITIFEGRNRTGGRTWTTNFNIDNKAIKIDVGATYVEGPHREPIVALCKQFEMKLVDRDWKSLRFDSKNQKMDNPNFERLTKVFEDHMKKAMGRPDKDTSAKIALERFYKETNQRFESTEMLQFLIHQVEIFEGGSFDEISAWSLDENDKIKVAEGIVQQGYGTLVEKYSQGLNIQLNQIVKGIDYSNPSHISVHTNQGEFKADFVVCTVPLGCLKMKTIQFKPDLPIEKQKVIAKMGMGVLDKIVLEFPKNFWGSDLYKINKLFRINEKEFDDFLSWDYVIKNTPIIVTHYAANFAKEIEKLSDEETIQKVMKVFQQCYGNDIPSPVKYFITRWNRDPFSFGSYSFHTIGCTPQDNEKLGEPIEKRIYFAGEAYISDACSFVNGAFLAGKRDAERIGKLIQGETEIVN